MLPFAAKILRSFTATTLTLLFLVLVNADCGGGVPEPARAGASPRVLKYQVVQTYLHDPHAFTQGLLMQNGQMFESTGEIGRSSLRRVELETGRVLRKIEVPPPFFAEGLAFLNGKFYQLTWEHRRGFIYDASTLEKMGEFSYQGEGWGLTTDGKSLLMSDGSNQIRFLDPSDFRVTKTISVVDRNSPVKNLNELEYVKGELFANVWHDNRILIIDPDTGRIKAWVNMLGLLRPDEVSDEEAVLNGIAYDQSTDRLFVTGKLWPKLFEIRLKE